MTPFFKILNITKMNAIFYALLALVLGVSSPTFSIDTVDKIDKDQQTQRTVGENGEDPEDEEENG